NANIGVLGDYGVNAGLLLTLQAAINNYVDLAPRPVTSQKQKQAERIHMKGLFADADRILKERMDNLLFNFLVNGNTLFYGEYFASREMIKPGSFTTVLKILVLNGANNEPLRNVKCYRDDSGVVKKSSKKGLVTY